MDRIKDTRPIHRYIFCALTPAACPNFAGHYRGEDFPYLKHYNVGVEGDDRVGTLAEFVSSDITLFCGKIDQIVAGLDVGTALPNATLPPEQKLLYVVEFAANILTEFLRIHPYANGNGHISRFIVWAVLGRYGYWPVEWPLDDRPPHPYVDCISRYRSGDHAPLVNFMLKCIVGTPGS
jgi:fido (protein-threonine AMPylation protein)